MMKELKTMAFWQAVLAELVGVMIIVFTGICALIGNGNSSYPDQEVKVALAFGLAVGVMIQSLCQVSGGHLNPAITLSMLVSCQISMFRALCYILAQMTGAVIASGIVMGVRPSAIESLGLNKLNGVSPGQGFGVEFLITLQLVLCFLATTDKRRAEVTPVAPLAIGLSVVCGHLAGLSYTGSGMNPARSFGPALVALMFEDHWVYWAGPLCASVVAALMYDFVLAPRGSGFVERLKVLYHGVIVTTEETEPLMEGE